MKEEREKKTELRFNLLTLFPEFFKSPLQTSLLGKSIEKKIIEHKLINIRDYSQNRHNKVDDTPYGGGAGMVMMVEPIYEAVESIRKNEKTLVVLTSPRGAQYSHEAAKKLYNQMIENGFSLSIISGHYEGIDARVESHIADYSFSIGPYINSGGEIASLVFMDSIARLHPHFMRNPESVKDESFSRADYIEYPQYTRPAEFKEWKVPEVLLSGNHGEIEKWRKKMSLSDKQNQEFNNQ